MTEQTMPRYLPPAAALLLIMAAPATAQQGAPNSATQGQSNAAATGHSGGSGLAGFLSPEQMAMFRRQAHGMAQDQRKGWRRDQMQKFAAMSESDRIAFKDGLQRQWDALPQKQKDRIQQRLANRMTQQNSGL
jgi:hypothetical protein